MLAESVYTLCSAHLDNERQIWVRESTEPAGSTAQHMAVFLDGEFYRERVGADAVIDDLYARSQIADSWFVYVSMSSVEARWLECPCYPPFARFVAEELLPPLDERYPAIQAVRQRTLVGLSYTGLATAFVAKEYPGVFQSVISQSGSFWSNDGWLIEQFRTMPQTLPTAFHLDIGRLETQENVLHREDVLQVESQIDAVRRCRDVLLDRGHAVRYVEFDGGHDFAMWRETLPDALRWALPIEQSGARADGRTA
jgi:enterochelin esterase family protein